MSLGRAGDLSTAGPGRSALRDGVGESRSAADRREHRLLMVSEPNPASLTVARLRKALTHTQSDQVVLSVLGRNEIEAGSTSDGVDSIVYNVDPPAEPAAEHNTFILRPASDAAG